MPPIQQPPSASPPPTARQIRDNAWLDPVSGWAWYRRTDGGWDPYNTALVPIAFQSDPPPPTARQIGSNAWLDPVSGWAWQSKTGGSWTALSPALVAQNAKSNPVWDVTKLPAPPVTGPPHTIQPVGRPIPLPSAPTAPPVTGTPTAPPVTGTPTAPPVTGTPNPLPVTGQPTPTPPASPPAGGTGPYEGAPGAFATTEQQRIEIERQAEAFRQWIQQQQFGLSRAVTEAELAAKPRNVWANYFYQRGIAPQGDYLNPLATPWAQSAYSNRPLPSYGGVGWAPRTPAPNPGISAQAAQQPGGNLPVPPRLFQLSPRTMFNLAPTEREGLFADIERAGGNVADELEFFQRSLPVGNFGVPLWR